MGHREHSSQCEGVGRRKYRVRCARAARRRPATTPRPNRRCSSASVGTTCATRSASRPPRPTAARSGAVASTCKIRTVPRTRRRSRANACASRSRTEATHARNTGNRGSKRAWSVAQLPTNALLVLRPLEARSNAYREGHNAVNTPITLAVTKNGKLLRPVDLFLLSCQCGSSRRWLTTPTSTLGCTRRLRGRASGGRHHGRVAAIHRHHHVPRPRPRTEPPAVLAQQRVHTPRRLDNVCSMLPAAEGFRSCGCSRPRCHPRSWRSAAPRTQRSVDAGDAGEFTTWASYARKAERS